MSFTVWLVQRITHERDRVARLKPGDDEWAAPSGWYAKRVDLPIPPAVGMGVILHRGTDPDPIEQVFVNEVGAAVCMFGWNAYDKVDVPADEWPQHVKWLTDGWERIDHCCGWYKLPPNSEKPTSPARH